MVTKKDYENMLEEIQGMTKDQLKTVVFMKDSEDFERIDSMEIEPKFKSELYRMMKDRTWLELAFIKSIAY